MSLELRPAAPDDLDAMAAIEAASPEGASWSRAQLAEELERPIARVLVAVEGEEVLGFALGWAVAGEAQVMEMAVAPRARRRGVGAALLAGLIEACGGGEALLEVRASNTAALALYARAGFTEVGRRPRYYADGEDAALMTRPEPAQKP